MSPRLSGQLAFGFTEGDGHGRGGPGHVQHQVVVAFLLLLIQAPLVLFGVFLLIILSNPHRPTAYPALVIFAASTSTSAPFTLPLSRALQALIQRSHSSQIFFAVFSCFKWRTTHENTDDAIVTCHKAKIRLAISHRLYAATSKAVENLPVFTAILDQ